MNGPKDQNNGEKTPYRGVRRLEPRVFQLRGEFVHPKTGRRNQFVRIVDADDAEHAATIRRSIRAGLSRVNVKPTRVRVVDAATSWLRSSKDRVRPSTLRHYGEVLDTAILPPLGDFFVDAISSDDIVAWKEAQKGKPSTIAGRLKVLRLVLADPTDRARIPNPAASVKAPRITQGEINEKVLTVGELATFVDRVRSASRRSDALDYGDVIAFLAWTGTRYCEAAGLQWSDVDRDDGSVTIRRAWYRGSIGPTKTGKTRVVPLAGPLAAILDARRASAGDGAVWVFPGRDGEPVRQVGLTEAMASACRALEMRKVSPHALRHTWITHCHAAGASPRAIRAISGHAAADVHDAYGHVTLDERRTVIRALEFHRSPNGSRPRLTVVRTETVGETVGDETPSETQAPRLAGNGL